MKYGSLVGLTAIAITALPTDALAERCVGSWGGVAPTTSLELADLILDRAEVAVVPGEAFGPSGYLRLSYALGDADLAEGVARLARLFGAA